MRKVCGLILALLAMLVVAPGLAQITEVPKPPRPQQQQGRLTLESGVPISTTDQTAKTTIYYTPHVGNMIALYTGRWEFFEFSELSIKLTDAQTGTTHNGTAVIDGLTDTSQLLVGMEISGTGVGSGATIASIDSATQVTASANSTASGTVTITFKIPASKNVDIFAYAASGAAKLIFGPLWTDSITRATALARQNGRWTLSGTPAYLYLGTVRTTSTAGQTEDSGLPAAGTTPKRYVYNEYWPVCRFARAITSTASWNYTTATYREANGATTNRIEFVRGNAPVPVVAVAMHRAINTGGATVWTGVGLDSTSTDSSVLITPVDAKAATPVMSVYYGTPTAGYHYLSWLERSTASGTTTWYGTSGTSYQSGIFARICQ